MNDFALISFTYKNLKQSIIPYPNTNMSIDQEMASVQIALRDHYLSEIARDKCIVVYKMESDDSDTAIIAHENKDGKLLLAVDKIDINTNKNIQKMVHSIMSSSPNLLVLDMFVLNKNISFYAPSRWLIGEQLFGADAIQHFKVYRCNDARLGYAFEWREIDEHTLGWTIGFSNEQ